MPNQTKGLLHYSLRKRIYKKFEPYPSPNKFKRSYDKFIYAVIIFAPIANIPQLLAVWVDRNASGVSPISWSLFSAISLTWLVYGIIHRDKHILIMNAALMIVQAMIAIGAVLYGKLS